MASDVISEKKHLFLGSRLKRLAEQMQGDVVLVAHQSGVPIHPGQYPLLATLDQDGAKTIGELAQAMQMSQPAITKNAGKLEKAGLVAIARGGRDKRQSSVSLTPTGRGLLDRSKRMVWPLVEAAVREVMDDLTGSFLDQITTIEERLSVRSLSARALAIQAPKLNAVIDTDLPAIVSLMNRAYRGTGSDASWNSEADFIVGDRTNAALLRQQITEKPEATLLVWRERHGVQGCVWLEPLSARTWYLGSLTVDPSVQNEGRGRQLLTASENWVRERGGGEIRMSVVNVRDSLIAWYARRGYLPTGETEPFPYDDARFGIPQRDDLAFVVLRKQLY